MQRRIEVSWRNRGQPLIPKLPPRKAAQTTMDFSRSVLRPGFHGCYLKRGHHPAPAPASHTPARAEATCPFLLPAHSTCGQQIWLNLWLLSSRKGYLWKGKRRCRKKPRWPSSWLFTAQVWCSPVPNICGLSSPQETEVLAQPVPLCDAECKPWAGKDRIISAPLRNICQGQVQGPELSPRALLPLAVPPASPGPVPHVLWFQVPSVTTVCTPRSRAFAVPSPGVSSSPSPPCQASSHAASPC